jgi:hypothetical protein
MPWTVIFHPEFDPEYEALEEAVQDALAIVLMVLRDRGPQLGRPMVDTLNGSDFPNMKELRVTAADGEWRFAAAFDPKRRCIVLCGGSKAGVSPRVFYKALIREADARFRAWRKSLEA